MRYRTVHAAALATLLTLPLAATARAAERPAHAVRGGAAAAPAATAAPGWLDLLRALWRGDVSPGNSGSGNGGPPGPSTHIDPPEGSGLCPHGMMH